MLVSKLKAFQNSKRFKAQVRFVVEHGILLDEDTVDSR